VTVTHGGDDRGARRRLRSPWAIDLLGVLAALLFALLAVLHLLWTQRSWLLFFDGDSVILPLFERSLQAGQPFEWAMSTTVFLIEIPVYLVLAFLTANPFDALTVNAILNFVALYALIRLIAGLSLPGRGRRFVVAVSLVTFAVPLAATLLESTTNADSFELFSLLATTTYYYPTVLAMLAAAWLLARMVARDAPTETTPSVAPDASDGPARPAPPNVSPASASSGRRVALLVALGMLTVVSVTSNPLYGVWTAAPAVVTLLGLAGLGRIPWRTALVPSVVLIAGCFGGVLLRKPLAPYLSMDPANYLHIGDILTPLRFYGAAIADMFPRPTGVIELVLLSALGSVTLVAGLAALRMPQLPLRRQLLFLLAAVTVLAVAVGSVLVGTNATRYLQPLAFAPLLVLPALIGLGLDTVREKMRAGQPRARLLAGPALTLARRDRAQPTASAPRHPTPSPKQTPTPKPRPAALGLLLVVLLLGGIVGAGSAVAASVSRAHLPGAACLEGWLAGRTLTGAGQFWAIRGLKTYGAPNVHLLQIDEYLNARPWMVNLADYEGGRVSYLVLDDRSAWGEELVDTLGAPRANISCGSYTILDYEGTAGEKVLTRHIAESATAQREQRGFAQKSDG